jgi:polyferredoxin/uncharacterized protein with FMN-binding domain
MKATMRSIETRKMRILIQISAFIMLAAGVVLYYFYINGILDFRILGIGDLNPYGGWSALREYAMDSSYVYEGVSRSMALTAALLVTAAAGGRMFCGWLCPIGTVQDFCSRIGCKIGVKKYKGIGKKSYNPLLLKYPILLSVLVLSILGYGAAIADISPWRALLSLPKLTSAWAEMKPGLLILAGIIISSMFLSRFFCRYLCPLGAAQTLFSSLSLLSIKVGKSCSRCNGCLEECPVGIRLSSQDDAVSPECIRCFRCTEECSARKASGLYLGAGKKKISEKGYILILLVLFFAIWLGVPALWGGNTASEDILPGLLKDGTYLGEARGFAGQIITEVVIDQGRITDIKILEHHECSGWYEEVFMVLPREIIRTQRLQVDVVSGATKSSKGLIRSIENALKSAL